MRKEKPIAVIPNCSDTEMFRPDIYGSAICHKFFDSLSAGKPVLLNYSGWQRRILEDNGAGFGCSFCNLDEFFEKVLYLNSHREKLSEMGRKARRLAIEQFDRDNLSIQTLEQIELVLRKI